MNSETYDMLQRLKNAGISSDDAFALRRVSMTLHRWHELECGIGDTVTWYVERAGANGDGKPFMCNANTGRRYPTPDRETGALKRLAAIMMPVARRLPFSWVYPTGEKQEKRIPKWEKYYQWASVIAGDCHYIRRHMPDRLEGKVVVTNTTTPEDVDLFRQVGIRYLVTTTPVLQGRSFGTNMMEAALVAISGKGRKLTGNEYEQLMARLGIESQVQDLQA